MRYMRYALHAMYQIVIVYVVTTNQRVYILFFANQ